MNPNDRKRVDRPDQTDGSSKRGDGNSQSIAPENDAADELVFEDPFGDEFDEEDTAAVDTNMELENEDNIDEEETDALNDPPKHQPQVWRPGVDGLEEGETLEYDPSAYIMYHALNMEWPCLSFDFIKDNLGDGRQRFPLTLYAVCGSQADKSDKNKLTLLKLSDMHKTQIKDDSEDESDDEGDDLEDDPTIEHINVNHSGGINRVRVMPQSTGVVASMADSSAVHIYDLSASARSMMQKGPRTPAPMRPTFSFRGHRDEGFALDWSQVNAGQLATGDCEGGIHVWRMESSEGGSGSWTVDAKPFLGHTNSPSEGSVFCSCSADKSVRIWDTRAKSPQISLMDLHSQDINVISWNKHVSYLLASGSDDGSFKVWDLRSVGGGGVPAPLANFNYHKEAVTSIEWAAHDESVLCVSSADDQVTIWDLSVEPDDEAAGAAPSLLPDVFPPQLLFIHQGQHEVKEVHFHPQIPGLIMTTAEDGLNVFKPAITAA
eukprot:gene4459-8883_t